MFVSLCNRNHIELSAWNFTPSILGHMHVDYSINDMRGINWWCTAKLITACINHFNHIWVVSVTIDGHNNDHVN